MMKRIITQWTAALALLVALAIPIGMRGQTRTTLTASYGFETGDAGWTATSFVTTNTSITAHGGSRYGATNGGSTANVKYDALVANPLSLTCYYSKTTTNTNAGSHFEIQVSTNNSTWTTVAEGLGMDKVTKGTWYELTADLSSYSDVYVRVYYTGTSAVRALDDIILTYDDGSTPSTDPEISFSPASITLDEVLVGNEVSTTFSVSQANLTSDITLSVDNGSLNPSSIAQGETATTVTWTYTPTTAGAISATVTATSGNTSETLAISGTAIAPIEGYDVDFEYATNMYPSWTFDNMTTYQTGSITAHGGTYYGTTGGKASASITTTSTVANPGTLTCYVSKQTTNSTSSTWYIQVSEDGSTWTNVESQSATSMSQGSWVEFSADLTDYTDVYVRVYYSGSTAVRNIDDLTLTTVTPSSAVTTTTTINVPDNFNTDIYQGTNAGMLTATVKDNADNAISEATVTWGSSNTGVATINANGEVTLGAVGTTTITACYAGVENEYKPSQGTYELTVTDSNAPGTENHPYTVAQAIENTPSSGTTANVYIHGIVSRFHSTSIIGDGTNYRYYISDDGTTSNELLVYKGKGLNNEPFTDENDLLVGDEVTICGGLTMYSNTPEIAANNYLVSLTHKPSITLVSYDPVYTSNSPYTIEFTYESCGGNVDLVQPANFSSEVLVTNFFIQFCDAEGHELTDQTIPLWFLGGPSVTYSDDQFYLYVTVATNEDSTPRTCYFKVVYVGDTPVYSDLVTVTQAAAPQPIITVTPSTVNATAAETNGTLTVAYENVNTGGGVSINWYEDAQGTTILNEAPSWILADFATDDINTIEYLIEANTNEARVAYFKVRGVDHYSQPVNSDMVTINQAAPVPTFDITFDVDGGSFVGNEDFPEEIAEKEAGTYTLPSATKDMYIFTGWNVGDETYAAGAEYTVSGDVDFVAGYAPGVMYNFAGANNFYTDSELTTHPNSGSSNNVGTIYYGDGSAFVASGTKRYFSHASSGYFLLGPTDASLILPTFSGYKITQVKIHSSGGHSTSVAVSIVSGENTASDAQTWSSQNTDYTYNIGEDYQTSTLAVKVTTNNNAQFTSITLVLQSYNPNALATMDAIYAKAVEVGTTSTEVEVDFGGWIVTGVHNTNDVFVTDGTKGFVIQEEDHGFEVGNTLTGTVTCNIELAGSFNARITGVKASDLTIGQGTPMATTIPMDELSGINTGALVTYNGLTYNNNNGTLSDGVNTIKKTNFLYNSYNDFTDGFVYSVTGVIWGYNNNVEISPRSANDIVKAPTSIIFTVNNTVFTPNDAYHIELPYLPSGGFVDHVVCVNFPAALTAGDFHVEFCDADGNSLPADPSWIELARVTLLPAWSDDPTLYLEVNVYNNADDEARTAYFKVWAYSSNQEMVYSDIVTVTQAANVVTYSLTTEIVSGKHYIITSGTDGSVKAMGSQSANNRSAVSVTVTDGVIPETEGVYEVVIIGPDVEGYYTLYDVTNEKYLYAAGIGSSNHLKSQNDIDDRARWTITFNDDAAVINSITTETDRTLMRYNSGSNCFSCYGSGQNAIYLFAKDNEPTVSYEKEIASYGTSLNGGYYLIASPVGQVTPTVINQFLTNDYDLYAFDQSEDAEWRNYEAGSFNLISGRGYLYANNGDNVTLTFEGYPYVGNGQVVLAYDGNAEFAGWNLVGNPFNATAYLENNRPFYVLDETGTELVESSGSIGVMQGLFVKATATGDNVTFTTSAPQTLTSGIHANLSSGSRLIDRATICFGEGSQLPKFQLNPDNTKLYITEGNIDYAVVNSNSKGEMPVNFKAGKNGSYTISVEPENVEVTYLHLIDNLTGANVDLLANPSYTFEANKGDNANRFRLVFKAGTSIEENASTNSFAYFNGSAWVISNTGDATLQVIDMMGRVLSSEQISGNTAVNINETAGIYMLRLVNGENVMVQKVVVR